MLLSSIARGRKGMLHVFMKHYCVRLLVNVFPRNTSSPGLFHAVRSVNKGGWTAQESKQNGGWYIFVLVEYPRKRNKVGKAG